MPKDETVLEKLARKIEKITPEQWEATYQDDHGIGHSYFRTKMEQFLVELEEVNVEMCWPRYALKVEDSSGIILHDSGSTASRLCRKVSEEYKIYRERIQQAENKKAERKTQERLAELEKVLS